MLAPASNTSLTRFDAIIVLGYPADSDGNPTPELLARVTPIAAQRAAAFDLFAKEGLPHRRVEEWKYTDLRALMREAKPLASPPDAAAKARARTAGQMLGDVETRRIVFVDGAFVPELSDTAVLERGLTVGSLAAALADRDPLLTAHLGKLAPGSDVAVALNTALMGDGAVIRIGAGSTSSGRCI